ncbi:MAG: M28 family peptidase [Spirosomataceae bacterium]
MKFKTLCLSSFCICAFPYLVKAQDVSVQYAQSITPQDLEKHLRVVAHDSLEGRDTGSPGQKKAAQYVANFFQSVGLKAIVPTSDGTTSYFQPYSLYQKSWGEVYLATEKQRYELQQDFYLSGLLSVLSEEKVPVVFAGYGVESAKYDDYAHLNVEGKAVIVLEGEPKNKSGQYWLSGDEKPSKWSNDNNAWQRKVALATSKGAKYVLIVSDLKGEEFTQQVAKRSAMSQRFNRLSMKPYTEKTGGNAAFTISRKMALDLLAIKEKKLTKIQNNITQKGQPPAASSISERTVRIKAERKDNIVMTENVMGFLEGTDKKEEVIVISAHLDHIGISADGQINNGADDDGSGTVSILELAEAFAKAKAAGQGPRRSILFMTVTGEEKGLWGSEYYTSNPVIPLANTVCDLNIDMIGRIDEAHKKDPKYVYIIGSDKLSSELHAIGEAANTKYVNYQLDYTYNNPTDPNRFYYRSDHYNFAKNKVPVIFYFTGVHEDYHRPGDDVEKILFDKQAKIVQLVFHTAWELANREERIKIDSNKP